MNERKTHDFISVDSFSQLPFIRRQMKPAPPPPPSNPPNIRLFGFNFPSTAADHPPIATAAGGTGDNGRKFECNYCCRNFPTSQALGGHQNAHKRERQHAKRAHMYGLVGYHRLGLPAAAATTSRFPFSHPEAQFYPSWNMAAPPAGLGSATQPIIGSPIPDMWRVPAATAAAAAGGEVGFSCTDSSSSSSTSPRKKGDYELKEGVSLDLHL